MAFHDWNGDGKKDFQDDFIEYSIYKHSTQKNNNISYNSGGGISNFGAGCGTVITFVAAAAIAGTLRLEGFALIVVFIILCAVIGGCIAWFFDEIGL